MWIAVAGSDTGLAAAQRELKLALRDPDAQLATKIAARERLAARSVIDLPGDRTLQEAVEWGKQNLADLTQSASNLKIRFVDQGKAYPAPVKELKRATFFGAGYPDYPWLFATDGEYTAFPAVALGQFETIRAHLIALRDVSDALNAKSGKVAHEIVTDGSVYFGANTDAGNTDESAKFASAVALVWRWTGDNRFRDDLYDFSERTLRYVTEKLDADKDGWPEGLGNVERDGMGPEKLDNAVYLIRGLYDLADMAKAKKDSTTREVGRRPGGQAARALRRDVVERRLDPVRGLAQQPGQRAGPAAALDRRHADGGRADDRRARRPRASRPRSTRSPRWASARATASPAPARSTSGSSTPAARAARRARARRRSSR